MRSFIDCHDNIVLPLQVESTENCLAIAAFNDDSNEKSFQLSVEKVRGGRNGEEEDIDSERYNDEYEFV